MSGVLFICIDEQLPSLANIPWYMARNGTRYCRSRAMLKLTKANSLRILPLTHTLMQSHRN